MDNSLHSPSQRAPYPKQPYSRTPRIDGARSNSVASIGTDVSSMTRLSPNVSSLDTQPLSRRPSQKSGHSARFPEPKDMPTTMPHEFFDCHISDLATYVAGMLSDIVVINDRIPFDPDRLTRFHSRAPPGISIRDYLLRIIRFCNIDKAILVVLMYFVDLFSQSYANFNVNTLTVHRLIITGVAVASKGLCDTYCENVFYAKVGGISHVELNLLEVEFLTRVNYRIVPGPALLVQYFNRLIARQPVSESNALENSTSSATMPQLTESDSAKGDATDGKSSGDNEEGGVQAPNGEQRRKHSRSVSPPPGSLQEKSTIKSAVRRFLHPAKKKKSEGT